MNKFMITTSALVAVAVFVVAESINQQAFAEQVEAQSVNQSEATNQIITEPNITTETITSENTTIEPVLISTSGKAEVLETTKQTPIPGNVSYEAADLLAQRPVDEEQFCKDYPYNSACKNRTSQAKPEEVKQTEQPTTNEQQAESEVKSSGWAVTPEVSTLGLGASVTRSITPNLNAKVGFNAFSVGGGDIKETDVTYKADLNLLNISTSVDYHPWKNSGFRVSGGLVFQDNKVEGTAKPEGAGIQIEDNGRTYTPQELGSLKAKISFPNSPAPYLGIGWGNAVRPGQRWGFSVNLGAMFVGSPKVTLDPVFGAAAPDNSPIRNEIISSLNSEKRKLEKDLDWLNIYPVFSLGVSYQF